MAMYPLSTLADNTLITHSHLIEENGVKIVDDPTFTQTLKEVVAYEI